MYRPSKFFDLSRFAHRELFSESEMVWLVISKIQDYLLSQQLDEIDAAIESNVMLVNPEEIAIGKGTTIEAGAYIKGPCIIGENCQIRHGAYIRENVIIGNNCIIGNATELKNVIFLDHAKAGHMSYVADSIVGNRVNLGAGTKCANFRLDGKNIIINKSIDTNLRKFGAILGDDVQTGCNSVTNPGTLMHKKSSCYPCTAVFGEVPEKGIVKHAEHVIIA